MKIEEIYHFIQEKGIRNFLFDSRQWQSSDATVFFAIKSEKNNGHDFIGKLYEKGIRFFIVEEEINKNTYPDATFYGVENSVDALQEIARIHRSRFSFPVIGITGSNGKTIVKEWLYQLLQEDYSIVRSPQSYNSQIGVPLSVLQMNHSHNLGIFEAGVSKVGEMENISSIIQCDMGVFTSLGSAHDAGFENLEQKAEEKSKLFHTSNKIIYRKDIQEIKQALQKNKASSITWSFSKESDLNIQEIIERRDGLSGATIQAIYESKKIEINIPFSDEVSCHNAIICWLTLLELGVENEVINQRMQGLEKVAMRLELKKGINGTLLINDTYNLDVTSLHSSLRFMDTQAGGKKRTIILSDILQHKEKNDITYSTIATWLNQDFEINAVIGVGEEIRILEKLLNENVLSYFYASTDDFLKYISQHKFRDEIILVKGARKFKFEKVISRLEQQAHRTIFEINFNALKNNLTAYRKIIRPETKIMAMVKASAYGAGSVEVAKIMETEKIDYLAVAYTDEGVALREERISLPILVLNPEPSGFDAMLRYDLEPEIYSLYQLKQLYSFIKGNKEWKHKSIRVHLNLDTGMKRLGLEEKDISSLILFLHNKKIIISSIFTHLAGSDAEEHDDFSNLQILRFERMYDRLVSSLKIELPLKHILNSAGISRFPKYQFDMVRLGIGLYGVSVEQNMKDKLQIIGTLKATVSQIKDLKPGETVGYSRKGKVVKPTRIATVSIGYADGLSRKTGNGNYQLLIRGRKVSTIGVICMDMCMVDATNVPDVRIGDEVTIFGDDPKIEELADCLDTIPYEILTSISDRVKRVYVLD